MYIEKDRAEARYSRLVRCGGSASVGIPQTKPLQIGLAVDCCQFEPLFAGLVAKSAGHSPIHASRLYAVSEPRRVQHHYVCVRRLKSEYLLRL